jgi:hypothetical protein
MTSYSQSRSKLVVEERRGEEEKRREGVVQRTRMNLLSPHNPKLYVVNNYTSVLRSSLFPPSIPRFTSTSSFSVS